MRIIGGKFKGRRFNPPADKWPTRPTTDFAKEGLFNILTNKYDFEEWCALDLFGGTGNHSFELISRGCCDVTYVDKFAPAVDFVRKMSAQLQVESCLKIIRADVAQYIKDCQTDFDYIFAGPPYALPWLSEIPDLIFSKGLLRTDGLFVMEHNPYQSFKNHLHFQFERHYGKTIFSFFG